MRKLQAIFIFGGLFFFGSLALLALYAEYGFPWLYGKKADAMESYLQQRYQDEFTVSDVYFDLMHGRAYSGTAKAASTDEQFYVKINHSGEVESHYSDYWSKQASELFDPYFKSASYIWGDVAFNEQKSGCWSLQVEHIFNLREHNEQHMKAEILEALRQIQHDNLCVEHILISFQGDYIQLTKEQLNNVQSLQTLDYTLPENVDWNY